MKNLIPVSLIMILFAVPGMAKPGNNGVPGKLDALMNLLKPKTIFITSTFQNGNLGGLEGADQLCQNLADASDVVPEGDYVALLSTDDINAASRISPSLGPYIRPDGLPLAANFAALFHTKEEFKQPDLDLVNSPHMNELGEIQGGDGAWTGTDGQGRRVIGKNCANWTDGTVNEQGILGSVSAPSSEWLKEVKAPTTSETVI